MKKKHKYDPLQNPRISDVEIEKIENAAELITEKEFARLVKHSKKGVAKRRKGTLTKKAA